MDKETHEVRKQQWIEIIQGWSKSGQTKTAWCRENNVSIRQFYYWQREIRLELYGEMAKKRELIQPTREVPALPETRMETLAAPRFAEIALAPSAPKEGTFQASAVIKSGGITIELSNAASEELLEKIGKVIHGAF